MNPNPRSLSSSSSTRSPNHLPLLPNPHINCKTSSPNGCSSSSSSVSGTSESGDHEELQLVVVSFYKFADFPDHADLRKPLKELCEHLYISGGIILAPEGINGSICGIRNSVEKVLDFIRFDDRLKGLRQIESPVSPEEEEAIHHGHTSRSPVAAGEEAPFRWDHVRVKLKEEIVSLGMPSVSPNERVGKYVSPNEWNTLISDPDTVVFDVRNDYETRIGNLKGQLIHIPQLLGSYRYGWMINSKFLHRMPKWKLKSKTRDVNLHLVLQCTVQVAFGVRKPRVSSSVKGLKRSTIYKVAYSNT